MTHPQQPTISPYGSWKSPITTDLMLSDVTNLGLIMLDGDDTYWIEGRPTESGRNVIVRRTSSGEITEITPPPFNARTRVHEYGGGEFVVSDGEVYFSHFADQRLYRVIAGSGATPTPLTPEGEMRYADATIDKARGRLICVGEDHSQPEREAVNTLVGVPLAGGSAQVLVSGNDFYAAPRLSPDGSQLCWLTWNHPNMPWDGCELWVGDLHVSGQIANARLVAGGPSESIFQPQWSPDGLLYFVSDRSGWWNIYRQRAGQVEAVCPRTAEFGQPHWTFNLSTYAFTSPEQIICTYGEHGRGHLASLNTTTGQLIPIETPYTAAAYIRATAERVVFIGGSPTRPSVLAQLDLKTGQIDVLRYSRRLSIDSAYLSLPQPIEFPTENGLTAYAIYYPPHNADYKAPEGELPPLIVQSHGGPTSVTSTAFNPGTQFWTSRGFAVLDVNYGGSSGYGRAYRERLKGQWGVVDVDDCANGAKYLVERGLADGKRLIIRGGSAGGYTTLCALTFRNVFNAGASHFGVSDLDSFVKETHKYESRYLHSLIGPYPERRDLYIQRSAINFIDQLSCPVIFFQGLEDKVVPPNQAELMVEALRKKKVPVAYVAFEGEQHGFRRAENIKRSLENELYFYSRVFNFALAEKVEPVEIENL
ncbi:MAG TPA: S9 family peptidase [Ktedonobacteraceae bacterium]|nr:S9 family peptidase [Ktedonobacteraceae bacterium]